MFKMIHLTGLLSRGGKNYFLTPHTVFSDRAYSKTNTTKHTLLLPFKSVSHQKKDLLQLKMPFFIFLYKYVFS